RRPSGARLARANTSTLRAPGRNARMMRRPSLWRGPSAAKGSAWVAFASAATTARSSGRKYATVVSAMMAPSLAMEDSVREPAQTGERTPQPIRAVGCLVADLVGGFLDQEEIEQRPIGGVASPSDRRPIGRHERADDTDPEARDELIAPFLGHIGRAHAVAPHHPPRDVIERPQHTAHPPPPAPPRPPFPHPPP